MALRFQPGGTLKEGSFYVERRADQDLPEALLQGEFCYVLAPRQIGKSSLRVRTAKLLQSQGVRCISVDLTKIGSQEPNPDSWFYALAQEVALQLALPGDPWEFWQQHKHTTPTHRFTLFLRLEVLAKTQSRVVLFIDEIDSVLSLPFSSDDFFAAIRAVYNDRAEDATLERLTFCLLGVAAPADLIQNPTRTPFNIGRSVPLEDFLPEEAAAFVAGLEGAGGDPQRLLSEVLGWTDGHPYMTQRICEVLTRSPSSVPEAERVLRIVEETFLRDGRDREPNLTYVESRLRDHRQLGPMLQLYRSLLQNKEVEAAWDNPVQLEMHLAGLVARRTKDGHARLVVRNRIFATVFDLAWVRAKESRRLLDEPLLRWIESGKQNDFLLRGEALKQALDWSRGRRDITDEEREYLLGGLEIAQKEEQIHRQTEAEKNRAERAEAQARARRQTIYFLTAALIFLLGALAGVGWQYVRAEDQRRRAEAESRVAEEQRRLAEASAMAERGLRAATVARQPGRQIEALVSGLQVGAHILHESQRGRTLPSTATEGLLVAARASVYSRVLRGHTEEVRSATFSPDGLRIVSAGMDKTARLWSVKTGETILVLSGHQSGLRWASFSPDSKRIVTAAEDKTARVWDAATGAALLTLEGHDAEVRTAFFSPDGTQILTASNDKTARIWDAEKGTELRRLEGHEQGVLSAVYSPNGQRILTASQDQTARVWDTKRLRVRLTLAGHTNAIRSAAFSPDGRNIVTASYDNTVRVYSAETGKAVLALEGHASDLRWAVYSPDGKQIVTASLDQTARVWDAETGRAMISLEGHTSGVRSAAYSPDGSLIVTASYDNTMRIWDMQNGRALRSLEGHSYPVRSAVYSPDGRSIVTASMDHTARIWDAPSGQSLRTLQGHGDGVRWAAYAPDGARIVTASMDKTARIWEVASGKSLLELTGHGNSVLTAQFSPDGKFVVTASDDYSARIWDSQTGAAVRSLQGHNLSVQSAAYSPDGLSIVTTSLDHTAKIWEAATGTMRLTYTGHTGRLLYGVFSPDGTRVVTSSDDNTARIWDAKSGRTISTLEGHVNGVRSATFSPDGNFVVTASYDNTARIWDANNGKPVLTQEGHTNGINSATYSPDGRWIVTASSDRTAKIHPASLIAYFTIGCNLLRSNAEFNKVKDVCRSYLDRWPAR